MLPAKGLKSRRFIYAVSLFVLFTFIGGTLIIGGISLHSLKMAGNASQRAAPPTILVENQNLQAWKTEAGKFPRDPFILHRYAEALLDAGKLNKAREEAMMAIRFSPKDPSHYQLLGKILERQGKQAEAAADYDKAAKLTPGRR